jgi:hypothetical protein
MDSLFMKKCYGYWIKEKCQEEALKYTTRNEFCKKSKGAYEAARINDWLNDICYHMIYTPYGYWTKEKCQEEALLYTTKMDFRIYSNNVYSIAIRNGWISDICLHMLAPQKPSGYWTKEKCQEEALKYNSRKEFYRNSSSAYTKSIKNNWIDDVCEHMKTNELKLKRCIYAYEFSDNYVYIGLTYNLKERQYNRKSDKNDAVSKHIKETGIEPIIKQLTEYIDEEEASKLEGFYVEKYKTDEWIILNRIKTGSIGGNIIK